MAGGFCRRTTWKPEAEEEPGEFSRSVHVPSDRITSSYVISERCTPHLSIKTTGVWSVQLAMPVLADINKKFSLVPDLHLSCSKLTLSAVDMENIILSIYMFENCCRDSSQSPFL